MHFDLKSLIAMSRCSRLNMIFLNTCSCSLANLTRKYSSDSKNGMSTAAASVAARRSRNANYLDSLDVPAYVLNHISMGQVWPEGKTISNSVMKMGINALKLLPPKYDYIFQLIAFHTKDANHQLFYCAHKSSET